MTVVCCIKIRASADILDEQNEKITAKPKVSVVNFAHDIMSKLKNLHYLLEVFVKNYKGWEVELLTDTLVILTFVDNLDVDKLQNVTDKTTQRKIRKEIGELISLLKTRHESFDTIYKKWEGTDEDNTLMKLPLTSKPELKDVETEFKALVGEMYRRYPSKVQNLARIVLSMDIPDSQTMDKETLMSHLNKYWNLEIPSDL